MFLGDYLFFCASNLSGMGRYSDSDESYSHRHRKRKKKQSSSSSSSSPGSQYDLMIILTIYNCYALLCKYVCVKML